MPEPNERPAVVDNVDARRFETTVDGHLAVLTYRRHGERLLLVHTEVPDALEGRGIGSALVRAAIDVAVAQDLTVVPLCPFARWWLERYPDVAAHVTIDWRPGSAAAP
jgi:uncharacterized protein